MTKVEKQTIQSAVKFGFTFSGDSFFSSYLQAKRVLNKLVKQGYLTIKKDERENKSEYLPTKEARDFVKYGIEI